MIQWSMQSETETILWQQQKPVTRKLKKNHQWEHIKDHPARYALVELENLHDDSQQFEPIHRVITGTDPEELIHALKTECCSEEGQTIRCYYGKKEEVLHLNLHKHQLAVDKNTDIFR